MQSGLPWLAGIGGSELLVLLLVVYIFRAPLLRLLGLSARADSPLHNVTPRAEAEDARTIEELKARVRDLEQKVRMLEKQ